MRSHDTCTHAATPRARRTCREMRKYAQVAQERGLEAQVISEGNFSQLIAWNPRDQVALKLVWTRAYDQGGYKFLVITPAEAPRSYHGANMLRAWLSVLARRA
jgi:hypothetical protein